jgi:hypothetical protein
MNKTVGPGPNTQRTWVNAGIEIIPLLVVVVAGLVLVSVVKAPSTQGMSIGMVMGLFAAGLPASLVYWALFSEPKKPPAAIIALIAAAFIMISVTILGVPWITPLVLHPPDQENFNNNYLASYAAMFSFALIYAAKQMPLTFGRMMTSQ